MPETIEHGDMHDLGEYKGTVTNALKAFIQTMHQ